VRALELSWEGTALLDNVRVVTVPLEIGQELPSDQLVEWPDERDPGEFAIEPYYFERDSGLVVTDEEVADRFRAARERDGGQSDGTPAGVVEADDGTQYYFWVRDELPQNIFDDLVTLL
jgi:hypothetical protein